MRAPSPSTASRAFRRAVIPTLTLLVGAVSSRGVAAREQEFVPLFNGIDLSNWRGNSAFWSVWDGAITGRTTAANPAQRNTFLAWSGGVVRNFELRLKFRIVADNERGTANSGIQYRSRLVDSTSWIVAGYQADFDLPGNYLGVLYEERGRGILAKAGERTRITSKDGKTQREVIDTTTPPAKIRAAFKAGVWCDYAIIVEGNHHRLYVNGKLSVDAVDLDEHNAATSGILAFQLHAGPPMTVQFKDIRLKTLP